MTTRDYRAASVESGNVDGYYDAPEGSGWVMFSVCMLGLAGMWNVIDGLLAIGSSHVYGVVRTYTFSDLKTWGWILLGVGLLELMAAFMVLSGSEFARWFGIAAAGINALAQLAFVPSYPFWALAMFTVDVLVIYGLAAYGGKRLRTM
jgi:hypothetical protein